MISFRPKKTGPRPLVTVREVYDKTCAVERAVGELQRTLDGRAAQRSHVLRYLGIAAVLTPLFWRLETYALGCRWLVSSGIIRDTVQVVTLFFRRDRAGTRAAGHRVAAAAALAL